LAEAQEGAVATAIGLGRTRGADLSPDPAPSPERETRARFREHLEQEIAGARRRGEALAVVAAEVDDQAGDAAELGEAAVDELRTHVAARIDDCLDEGAVVGRLGPDRFVILLPGATLADARSMLAVLQASLGVRPRGLEVGVVTLSAGVTELTSEDDVGSVLGRAEEALERARAGGHGAVIVAAAGP
jgi:diguanylate cyclase (GGDEF)-like protein